MTKNPCKVNGPAVISFSGGRTSGMMLRMILDAHGGALPDDVRVLFANTGKEMPQTLDFVRDCSDRWGVPITWLEYVDHDEPQQRWREVTYETASRNGEPFEALIARKQYLPNPVTRFCTVEMKIRVMKLYAQQVLGFDDWEVVIGFRADEPRRVAKLSLPNKEPFIRSAPLASMGVTKREVGEFWRGQPFDLRLPSMNGTTMHGNCDLCFLKGGAQIFSLIREAPERAVWWMNAERAVQSRAINDGAVFRADRMSYAQMHALATGGHGELFAFEDEPLEDCGCTD
jgi:3'-phosphoadenosine 5'-phosphosulfate sulfotransferase (PAPS reductase)/FAD synthetase